MPDLFVNPERDPQSEYTQNLPQILRKLQMSLVLATNRGLVIVRNRNDELNTHFIDVPGGVQGLYADSHMLVAGTALSISTWRHVVVAASNEHLGLDHDGCFLPLKKHHTGEVHGGEITVAEDGVVYFVNSLFSCIARIDDEHSFVPVWQPPFVSACTPEDRCRISGLALRDGRPAYVSALARSDMPAGWREHWQSGGVVVEVASGDVLAEGLCVPVSPRWHAGRLWVLEAGSGRLCEIVNGQLVEIARVPGFARGLAFVERYAFIAVSRVRQGSSLPVGTATETNCGVWMIDTSSAQTVAFLRFGAGLDEIYGVSVLPGMQYPALLSEDSELAKSIYRLPQ